MHEAVTTSSASTNSFYSGSSDELLPPFTLTARAKTGERSSESILEQWNYDLSPSSLQFPRRAPFATSTKLAPRNTMSSRLTPDSNTPQADTLISPDRPLISQSNNGRWRLNGSNQLVDTEAAAPDWDLADELVRMKIGHDADEEVPVRTPPQNKLAAAAVLQFNETSPLESSSDASTDSPHSRDHHPITMSHSRGSSLDTASSQESALSAASHTMLAPSHPVFKVGNTSEGKERPHSFSGVLSTADLRRLSQAGEVATPAGEEAHQSWSTHHNDRQFAQESQLIYPSLAQQQSTAIPRSQHQQQFEYRPAPVPAHVHRDELQVDYNIQPRSFAALPQHGPGVTGAPIPPPFVSGRPANGGPNLPYRPMPRDFAPQGTLPASTTALGYAAPGPVHHPTHLSLGSSQQLYDMMLQGQGHHPAVARVQQQHNIFPRTHQHSASDPSALRDAATLALLSNNMQVYGGPFGPAMPQPQPMSLYTSPFYPQEAYPGVSDVASVQQVMAARLQSQYTGPYGGIDQGIPIDNLVQGQGQGPNNGPSANNRKLGLYKTELCRSWEEKGTCRYATKCQFAHGEDELRLVARHPKYKTEICRTFWVSGSCPYGKRCCFIHTELPASGAPPGADNPPPPARPDGRERSMSTISDPNDASSSLLARIASKRTPESTNSNSNASSTPVDSGSGGGGGGSFPYTARPASGSLRVDTSTLDRESAMVKQNKSAYPAFASQSQQQMAHSSVAAAVEHVSVKSPIPVTAAPDLGRHNNSRLEIVGLNQRLTKTSSANPTLRHSFNGTEIDLNFTNISSPATTTSSTTPGHAHTASFSGLPESTLPRASGHRRSGSAGTWGSISRSSLASAYPAESSAAGDLPWSTQELAVGSSRLNGKAWA